MVRRDALVWTRTKGHGLEDRSLSSFSLPVLHMQGLLIFLTLLHICLSTGSWTSLQKGLCLNLPSTPVEIVHVPLRASSNLHALYFLHSQRHFVSPKYQLL